MRAVPDEPRPALALVQLSEGVGLRMGDQLALDLALGVGLGPHEICYAGTGPKSRLALGVNIGQPIAVSGTLLDAINPVVVDSTGAGVVIEPYRIRVVNLFAVNHAGLIQPIHVLPAYACVKVKFLNSVGYGGTVELTACLFSFHRKVVSTVASAFLRVGARANSIRKQSAVRNAQTLCIKDVVAETETNRTSRSHIGRTLTLLQARTPDETGQAGAISGSDVDPHSRRVGDIGAVELASSSQGIPTPVVPTVALVETGLRRKRMILIAGLTVYDAFAFYGVPHKILDACASVPHYLPCCVFCLRTDQILAPVAGIVPGLPVRTGTSGSLCPIQARQHYIYYFDVLPDIARESGPQGIGMSSIKQKILMVVQSSPCSRPQPHPIDEIIGEKPDVVRHVPGNLGILGTLGLNVGQFFEKKPPVFDGEAAGRGGEVANDEFGGVTRVELHRGDGPVLHGRLEVGQRDLLELVVVINPLECVEVDGGGRGNDHVEPIRTEITVPGIFHDLGKYDLLEAYSPVYHDGLAHQDHQLAVGAGSKVVDVGLAVQGLLHLLERISPVENEVVDSGNRDEGAGGGGGHEGQEVLVDVVGRVHVDCPQLFGRGVVVVETVDPLRTGRGQLPGEGRKVEVIPRH